MANPAEAVAGAAGDVAGGVSATAKKFTFINWAILSNPWNWVIVFLMVVIASIALDVLLQWYNSPDTEE